MVENLTNLSTDTLNALDALKSQVTFKNTGIRVGQNGLDKLSVYEYSKWKTWNRAQKNTFKSAFDSADLEKSLIGWFLKFPGSTGFLDVMDYWQNNNDSGIVLAYSLTDGNSIWIGGTEYHANRGVGFKFSLRHLHEVRANPAERNWACLLRLP
jgi:hypothetical protein